MTALRNACSATDTLLDVDVALGISRYPTAYTIDSEVVNVVGGGLALTLTVQRAIGGTTAATHTVGAALTAANAFSGGGGSLSVDNTVDPPAEVSTLIAPGAVLAGDEATLTVAVQQTTVTLTDDQIKGLAVAVFEVVPAQGSGTIIVPITAMLRLNDNAGAYTNVGSPMCLRLDFAGGNRWGNSVPAYFMTDAGLCQLAYITGASFWNGTSMETEVTEAGNVEDDVNVGINILGISGGGAFTGGNAANSMTITTLYAVVDL